MRLFYRLWLSPLLTGMVGCVPWPHRDTTAPQVSGTVTRDGVPVANVRVLLVEALDGAGKDAPMARKQEVLTDRRGHFSIGPIRRFSWTTYLPVFGPMDRSVSWGLKLSANGQPWRPGWLSDRFHLGYVLEVPVVAMCDLNAESKSSGIAGYPYLVGNGSCELTASESEK